MHKNRLRYAIFAFLWLFVLGANHAIASTGQKTFTQPFSGGGSFEAVAWQWLTERGWETTDGYTVMVDEVEGVWNYAVRGEGGKLVSSGLRVGVDTPPAGLAKHQRPELDPRNPEASPPKADTQPSRVGEATAPSCLGTPGSISGKVTNAAGSPLAGVEVTAWRWDYSGYRSYDYWDNVRVEWATTTDAAGLYTLPVEPGYYELHADAEGYAAYTHVQELEIASGASQTADLQLAAGASISGTITNEAGDPVAGWVDLYQYTGSYWDWVGYTSAATDGSYSVTGLAAGTYTLRVAGGGYIPEYYDNAANLNDADDILVATGQDVVDINIALAPGGAISGTILAPEGFTNLYGSVYLYDQNTGDEYSYRSSQSFSDYSGTGSAAFTLGGLVSGTYYIRVRYAQGYDGSNWLDLPNEYYQDSAMLSGATPIEVTVPDTTADIQIQLDPPGTLVAGTASISGTITDTQGDPLEGASVIPFFFNGEYWSGRSVSTAADGSYQASGLLPGTYYLRIYKSGYRDEYYDDVTSYGDKTEFELTADQQLTGIDADLYQYTSSISGRVLTSPAGIPVRGSVNVSQYVDGVYQGGSSSDTCGYYSVAVDSGTYRVDAAYSYNREDWARQWYDHKISQADATELVVGENDHKTAIDFGLVRKTVAVQFESLVGNIATFSVNFNFATGLTTDDLAVTGGASVTNIEKVADGSYKVTLSGAEVGDALGVVGMNTEPAPGSRDSASVSSPEIIAPPQPIPVMGPIGLVLMAGLLGLVGLRRRLLL